MTDLDESTGAFEIYTTDTNLSVPSETTVTFTLTATKDSIEVGSRDFQITYSGCSHEVIVLRDGGASITSNYVLNPPMETAYFTSYSLNDVFEVSDQCQIVTYSIDRTGLDPAVTVQYLEDEWYDEDGDYDYSDHYVEWSAS